jgi:FKBP-type peptidyl-prolyl cis-trans isomerase FklB
MKPTLLFLLPLVIATTLHAQKDSATTKPVPVIENISDSVNYGMGYLAGLDMRMLGLTTADLNPDQLLQGIKDAIVGKPGVLNPKQVSIITYQYVKQKEENKQQASININDSFLVVNKLKPGVKTTASGLQYKIIQPGNGTLAAKTDSVVMKYEGSLINGQTFDDNYIDKSITIAVKDLIVGWAEGMQLMPAGSRYLFYIPSKLAYGINPPPGSRIMKYATLILDVTLVSVKKKKL